MLRNLELLKKCDGERGKGQFDQIRDLGTMRGSAKHSSKVRLVSSLIMFDLWINFKFNNVFEVESVPLLDNLCLEGEKLQLNSWRLDVCCCKVEDWFQKGLVTTARVTFALMGTFILFYFFVLFC